MTWQGKLIGGVFGFVMGGPLGAILGATLGHQLDKGGIEFSVIGNYSNPEEQKRIQTAFFTATFSVMGHVAKADGVVSKAEINLATRIMEEMRLTDELRATAIGLFQQGKQADFPLYAALAQFKQECGRRKNLLRMFLEIQLQAALADGDIDAKEETLLLKICQQLGILESEYRYIKKRLQAQQRFYYQHQQWQQSSRSPHRATQDKLADAYAVLGLTPSASDAEIKRTYRRLLSQHHPDKLVAKGLPEQMMTLAKEKTQQITKAYEVIRTTRNL